MKRCEFLDISPVPEQEKVLPKHEDTALPAFSTDVPTAEAVTEEDGFVTIHYTWQSVYTNSPFLRAAHLVFRKGEELEGLFRLRVRDGIDTIAVRVGNILYLLRKTTQPVARSLLRVHHRISSHVENIVGYLQTLAGSIYAIAKVGTGSWSFDSQLAANHTSLQYVEPGTLNENQRQRLCELVQDRILALHREGLMLQSFTLHNVLFTPTQLLLTDLRDLRRVRKKSLLVEDFIRVLHYLISTQMASRGDVYQAVITYAVAMDTACQEWYAEKTGSDARDSLAMVGELEQALYL